MPWNECPINGRLVKFLDLERELDRGKIFPVYFLYGEERSLIDGTEKRIESICLADQVRDFNFDCFHGGETLPDRVIDAAKTLPMMAPRRVVVVRDVHLYTAEQVKVFLSYLENPLPTTCLILSGGSLGPWKSHLKTLGKNARVVAFPHLKGNLLIRHIVRGAERLGKEISIEAAEVIGELVGNHLDEIYQELGKVAAYVGDRKRIGIDDVEATVSPVRSETVFELTRAVGMKNGPEALRILGRMLERGEPHLRILTMMVRQFRLIWKAKEMRSRGMRDRDIGKAVGIPDFFLQGFLAQLDRFNTEELAEGYRRLVETDEALKSRSTSKRILLEHLVISLCRSASGAAGGVSRRCL